MGKVLNWIISRPPALIFSASLLLWTLIAVLAWAIDLGWEAFA